MYAIFETGGKQHKVTQGEIIRVEKLDAEPGSEIVFDNVMMVKTDENTMIGKPYVENASVKAEIIEEGKDKKIIVFKYKRKKNYQRKQGHRQRYTAIRITDIAVA